MSPLLTEQLDGWEQDYGIKPISPLSRSLRMLDRWAMAIAQVCVRCLFRAINLGFRMVERYEK